MILNVTMSVCEDIRFEVGGKLTVVGVYTGDIVIIPGPYPVKQILFLFQIEGTLDYMPKEMAIEVTIPPLETRRESLNFPDFIPRPDRPKWFIRGVVTFQNEIINAGRIVAKFIADGVEYEVGSPWVVEAAQPAPEDAAETTAA